MADEGTKVESGFPTPLSADEARRVDSVCDRFEAAWHSGNTPAIEEFLEGVGALVRPTLLRELIVVEIHYRKKLGETPKQEEYLVRFPGSETAVRAAFGAVDGSLQEVSTIRTKGAQAGASLSLAPVAQPRYRVVREHARGGLGEVFVAEDTELNREVALKEIRESRADDPQSRARFVLEAEVTGQLEHPGVVPVYGLGFKPDGRPYYAMRFVRGDSLAQAIVRHHGREARAGDPSERALALRALLRRFVDVCNAVGYANSRGVLHRDLKPGNVMLGPYGETLVVDWGLAKVLGRPDDPMAAADHAIQPQSQGDVTPTLAGSAHGTPAYMSPEQAAGKVNELGPASDVYGLGAVLYHLLTGRGPFEGREVEKILWRVVRGEFVRPRAIEPEVDRALEAVCLKAMAREVEDRYPSAKALADDVERWLADEPVSAWREPVARRAWRWVRRHRARVAGAAAAVLAATVGLAAVLAVQAVDNVYLREAFTREHTANVALGAANERERARFELAMDAIRTFHTGVSNDVLLKREEFAELRGELLQGARSFYDRLTGLTAGQTDPRSRESLAKAYTEVASLIGAIGSKDEAIAAYRKALEIREPLATLPRAPAELRDDFASTLNNLGILYRETGKPAEAEKAFTRALAIEEGLAAGHLKEPLYRERQARFLNNLGLLHQEAGRTADALAALEKSRSVREALVKEYPDGAPNRNDLAGVLTNLGSIQYRSGRADDALASWTKAREECAGLVAKHPKEIAYREALAAALGNIANVHMATGRTADSLGEWAEARQTFESLVRDRPNSTAYRVRLAGAWINLGVLQQRTGKIAEARRSYGQALAASEELSRRDPSSSRYRQDVALCLNNLGTLTLSHGDATEALKLLERSRTIRAELSKADPSSADLKRDLAVATQGVGNAYLVTGRPAEAEAEYAAARALWADLIDAYPGIPEYRDRLARNYYNAVQIPISASKPADAITLLAQARNLWRDLALANTQITEYIDRYFDSQSDLSQLLAASGDTGEAIKGLSRLITALDADLGRHPSDPARTLRLAEAHQELGTYRQQARDFPAAAALLQAAVRLREGLNSLPPDAYADQSRAHARLANLAPQVPGLDATAEHASALRSLRAAARSGFRDAESISKDPIFAPFQPDPTYRLLLLDMALPADPFLK